MTAPVDPNPYAPPTEAEGPERRVRRRRRARTAIEEAIEALDEHLSDPANVAADAKAAGPRVRVPTLVLCVIAALCVVGALASPTSGPLFPVAVGLAAVFGLLGILLLIANLSLVEHGRAAEPDRALKSFFKSIPQNRLGYAWAMLAPTAREQRVETPELAITTTPGEFTLESPEALKRYVSSFARPGGGQVRTLGVKRMALCEIEDDVAVVEADLLLQSWPSWVSGIMVAAFLLFRPLVLVGLILLFAMRKKHDVSVRRTLIRGRNGAWYLVDGDLLEGAGR